MGSYRVIKSACAHKKDNKIFLQAYSQTTVGLRTLDGPVFTVDENDILGIGEAILKVLNEVKQDIPHPTKWGKDSESPMLKAAGVKSWKKMMKTAYRASITLENERAILTPSKLRAVSGPDRGYDILEEESITTDLNPENLGKALLEAFKKCN